MAILINSKVLARLKAHKSNHNELYDVKIYKPDGREGSTVRRLTHIQVYALVTGLDECLIKSVVNLIT